MTASSMLAGLASGAVRYRRGFGSKLDGVAELTAIHVLDAGKVKTWPGAYALRIGAKHEAAQSFAVTLGVGAGGSAAGGFVSPDIGFILGYENRYLVPFLSMRGFFSQPFAVRGVVISSDSSERRKSFTTFGASAALGVRVPLQHERKLTHSLALGPTAQVLCGYDTCDVFISLMASFEGVLDTEYVEPLPPIE